MLKAAQKAALDGAESQVLLKAWKLLPTDSLKALEQVLILRQIPVRSLSISIERLRIAGIIRERVNLTNRSISLRSWYVESLIVFHRRELGLTDFSFSEAILSELMPTISVLNQDAYRLLQEIETLLRNFLIAQLWDYRSEGEPLLTDWLYKDIAIRQNGGIAERMEKDAFGRAEDWRERSREKGLPVDLNPDIAYLPLIDLAGILNELAEKKALHHWKLVSAAIEQVIYIRDAVMHNQIIEIEDLKKIYDLQNKIFSVLFEESKMSLIDRL